MSDVAIGPARVGETQQILKLQYLCYQSEAAIYDDWAIPPLTQALWQLLEEYDTGEVLTARVGEEVVGSVRGDSKATPARSDGWSCILACRVGASARG